MASETKQFRRSTPGNFPLVTSSSKGGVMTISPAPRGRHPSVSPSPDGQMVESSHKRPVNQVAQDDHRNVNWSVKQTFNLTISVVNRGLTISQRKSGMTETNRAVPGGLERWHQGTRAPGWQPGCLHNLWLLPSKVAGGPCSLLAQLSGCVAPIIPPT